MYNVLLKHSSNPDIKGGYWEPPIDKKSKTVSVTSLKDASKACLDFIDRNGLGGGNWTGGKVTDDKDNHVANISYNGRIWSLDYTKEITEVN